MSCRSNRATRFETAKFTIGQLQLAINHSFYGKPKTGQTILHFLFIFAQAGGPFNSQEGVAIPQDMSMTAPRERYPAWPFTTLKS